jgi:nicotinamide riboside transporter PnuC
MSYLKQWQFWLAVVVVAVVVHFAMGKFMGGGGS